MGGGRAERLAPRLIKAFRGRIANLCRRHATNVKYGIIYATEERGMEKTMKIADDIKYVGVNDHDIDLFEGQFVVPRGMAYNSYLVKDEKTLVFDSVDARTSAPR